MSEHYWRFAKDGGQAVYGWGTEEEASLYQDYLNWYWDTEHYHIDVVDNEEDIKRMHLEDEAFVIEQTIIDLKEQGDWVQDETGP